MPYTSLNTTDTAEIAEALTLLRQWLAGPDTEGLAASFHRFIGTNAYPLSQLRSDLARYTFLLGHDDGDDLFDTNSS